MNSFSLWAGMFYLLAGLCGLVRHFLLEPTIPNYPRAPSWLLNVVFGFAALLIYAGLRYLWVWGTGEGSTTPPGATGMGVLLGAGLFIYKGAMLYNVARQRYPVETWRRLNRITDLARCRPGAK
jgi:hypothetical protein